MVVRRMPTPTEFKVLVDGKPVDVTGWKSTHALAIARDGDNFASVMLLSGGVLARGFASLYEAHVFNVEVSMEKKLLVGTPELTEFYAHAGGLAAAKALVEKIRKKTELREVKERA